MSVEDVYLLPSTIKIDIHQLMEFDDLDAKQIMRMIKDRYTGPIRFNVADLKEYMDIMKERAKSEVVLPVSPQVVNSGTTALITGADRQLDNSPLADYRSSRQIMDMFKQDIVNGFTNLKRVKDDAYRRDQILNDLEAIALNYMRVGGDLMEKEGKLKLDMEESNKNAEYVRDEIRKMLMLVKAVLKKQLNEHKYRDVIEALAQVLELYKFKV